MLRRASQGRPMRESAKKEAQPRQFLSGWKEIAKYLRKGVRTVQRYEYQFGLPVRRPADKSGGSVVATKPELDAWVLASPMREAFHLTTRQNKAQHDLSVAAIRNGITQMQRLSDQMASLQSEVKTAVGLLRESIHSIHGETGGRWSRYTRRVHTFGDFQTEDHLNLRMPKQARKAN